MEVCLAAYDVLCSKFKMNGTLCCACVFLQLNVYEQKVDFKWEDMG